MVEELFDLSDKYEAMLQEGLSLSGESPQYFITGRLRDLHQQLPNAWAPKNILDFGCGIGHTTARLADLFPEAKVVGLDTSASALAHAKKSYQSDRISFDHLRQLPTSEVFDLCYVNGVFHHIEPAERQNVIRRLFESIKRGGCLAFFENNPWNPGTRLIMKRIPFDRDAVPLPSREAQRLIQAGGFRELLTTRYLFFFPRMLSFFRGMEPLLARFPMGAQYYVLARK